MYLNLAALAQATVALRNCIAHKSSYATQWEERIEKLCEHLPSGSGLDNGVKFIRESSGNDKLVFETAFHHMDEHGGYDGWTEHTIIITPTFGSTGYDMKITGRNRNDIKNYLADLFSTIFYIDFANVFYHDTEEEQQAE